MMMFLLAAQGIAITNSSPPPVAVPVAQPPAAAVQGIPVVRLVTPPKPRFPAQSYFSADDYPAAAVGTGAHGRVSVMLKVDTQGRITDCHILRSSGSSILDQATCSILHRRARFTPAMDSTGNAVIGYIAQSVEWQAR